MTSSERVTINEAAERLGVSVDTIRRRLKSGELVGEKVKSAQGFAWRVELPPDAPAAQEESSASSIEAEAFELVQLRERVIGLERLAEELQSERDAWREQAVRDGDAARELRILLRQAQTLAQALPASVEIDEKPDDSSQTRQNGPGRTEPPFVSDSSFSDSSKSSSWLALLWQRLRGE